MARFAFLRLVALALAVCVCCEMPVQAQRSGHGGFHGGGHFPAGSCHSGFLPYRGYFPGFVGIYIGPGYGYPYYYPPPVIVVPPPVYVSPPPLAMQAPATPAPSVPQSPEPPLAPLPLAPLPLEHPSGK
jgi:hypothetical protein